jgi:Tol biopolymer transport system component
VLVALVVIVLVAVAAGGIAIGARLLAPKVLGLARNGAISYVLPPDGLSPADRYYAGPDGQAVAVPSTSVSYGVCAAFSPNGLRLAFLGMSDRFSSSIVIAAADGSAGRRIGFLSMDDLDYSTQLPLSWSPDNRKIAVSNRVYSVDDGTSWRFEPGGAMNPAWAPDGRHIAFTTITGDEGDNYGTGTIWIADADGSNPQALTSFPVLSVGDAISPVSWSPDGSRLAFNRLPPGTELSAPGTSGAADPTVVRHLFVIDVDGGGERDLMAGARIDVLGVAFAPDGSRIGFIGSRPGSRTYAIGTIGPDGSDFRTQPSSTQLLGLVWAPDGTRILVTHAQPVGLPMDSVPADGIGPSITIGGNGLYEYCWPSWQRLAP